MAITTDLIAGFPGETHSDFQESLDFVRSMHFAGGHVFTFSERVGTPAAKFPHMVPERIRKERSSALRKVINQGKQLFYLDHLNSHQSVLWEAISGSGPDGLDIRGWTDNYIRVQYKGARDLSNEITSVILGELNDGGSTILAKLME
jgi:threonylcarbamoyladenosine tRNA methylthiotransferase MtaB